MGSTEGRSAAVPGGGLLHPLPMGAVLLLVLNDHWLKAAHPGWLTGKLSDFAGLAFFPLFLQSLWELGLTLARRPWMPSRRALWIAVAMTAVVFALVKTWPPATELFRWGLGALQSPVRGVLVPVAAHTDPTDLIALPALLLVFVPKRST